MEPRIKIKAANQRGWRGIVASAFDPEEHERYEEPRAAKAATVKPATPAEHVYTDEQIGAMPWPTLRSTAAKVSETPIETKEDAIAALQAHRAKHAPADPASGD